MTKLTLEEMETVQRALGLIEGISYGVDKNYAAALIDAVEMIDGVLGEGGKDG